MSLEQSILEHAAALREVAAAILKMTGATQATSTKILAEAPADKAETKKPEAKADTKKPEPKAEVKKSVVDDVKPLDYDKDVAPALTGYMKAHGRQAGIDLMAKFGAKKGSEIEAADYAAVLAEINAVE